MPQEVEHASAGQVPGDVVESGIAAGDRAASRLQVRLQLSATAPFGLAGSVA